MTKDDPVWVIEHDGEQWTIRGEGAPDSAWADSFGFIMEVAAAEAERLDVDPDDVVEVRQAVGIWRTKVRHVIEDYGS